MSASDGVIVEARAESKEQLLFDILGEVTNQSVVEFVVHGRDVKGYSILAKAWWREPSRKTLTSNVKNSLLEVLRGHWHDASLTQVGVAKIIASTAVLDSNSAMGELGEKVEGGVDRVTIDQGEVKSDLDKGKCQVIWTQVCVQSVRSCAPHRLEGHSAR